MFILWLCHMCTGQAKQEPREEFSDWPHGFLSIGTFGKKDEIKQNLDDQNTQDQDPSSSEEIADFTPEEIGKLQKELTRLLRRKPNVEKEISELPLDRFLNCPSSLEVDRRISNALCSESDDKEEDIEKTLSVILDRCKDVCAEKSKKSIGKKSISFLLKKMFVCRSGFAPTPSLRDTLQESRMEKVPTYSFLLCIYMANYMFWFQVLTLCYVKYTASKDNASQENIHPKFFSGIIDEEVLGGQEVDKE